MRVDLARDCSRLARDRDKRLQTWLGSDQLDLTLTTMLTIFLLTASVCFRGRRDRQGLEQLKMVDIRLW